MMVEMILEIFTIKIQNAIIKFTMWDLSNNAKRIANSDRQNRIKR